MQSFASTFYEPKNTDIFPPSTVVFSMVSFMLGKQHLDVALEAGAAV